MKETGGAPCTELSNMCEVAGPTITLGDRSETENLRPVFSDLGEFSDL